MLIFGEAAGVFTSHVDDILGGGIRGILERARNFVEGRFGPLELQESTLVHVGTELYQGQDFSVQLAQLDFTKSPRSLATSPALWANRQRLHE